MKTILRTLAACGLAVAAATTGMPAHADDTNTNVIATATTIGAGWAAWRVRVPTEGVVQVTSAGGGIDALNSEAWVARSDWWGWSGGWGGGDPTLEVRDRAIHARVGGGATGGVIRTYLNEPGIYYVVAIVHAGAAAVTESEVTGPEGSELLAATSGADVFQMTDGDFSTNDPYVRSGVVDTRHVHGSVDIDARHVFFATFTSQLPNAKLSVTYPDGATYTSNTHQVNSKKPGRFRFTLDEDYEDATVMTPAPGAILHGADVTLP